MSTDQRPEGYHPRYDNPLGPMPERGEWQDDDASAMPSSSLKPADGGGVEGEDTDAALKRLFGEGGNLHHYDAISMDPTLAESIQRSSEAAAAGVDHADGDISMPGDAPDESFESPTGSGDISTGRARVPRKGTTRINMLTRGGACEFCKRRKLKCSAEHPACAACRRAGKECVYSQKQQKSRVRILEDRLMELERKLDGGPPTDSAQEAETTPIENPLTNIMSDGSADGSSNLWPSPSWMLGTPMNVQQDETGIFNYAPTPDLGFTLPFESPNSREEPDLMTLADAAAGDVPGRRGRKAAPSVPGPAGYSWDGLSAAQIAGEIVKCVEGGKGVGERIVAHLLQFYVGPPSVPHAHYAIPPSAILSRLSSTSTSPPHPSLILSLLPVLLPLSPSLTLASNAEQISALLLAPARALSAHAYATSDPRLLDVIAGDAARALHLYLGARFLDGWVEAGNCASMAWAAGLGKMGGIGEGFVHLKGKELEERKARIERNEKLKVVWDKSAVVEPPKNAKELWERTNLFWQLFLCDKTASIGWGWPSAFNDDEITTPWPQETHDSPECLKDNSSIHDFLNMKTAQGKNDCAYAITVKSLTLFHRASRLFDLPADIATPERTSRLMRVTKLYMSAIPPEPFRLMGETRVKDGPKNQSWMVLHATMMLLHAKDEIDAPPGEEAEHFDKSVGSLRKIVEHIELAYTNGDFGLEGYDLVGAVCWMTAGKTAYKFARRLAGDPAEEAKVAELREMGDKLNTALKTLGGRMRFAQVVSMMLSNTAMGHDEMRGSWDRVDNI